MKKIFFLLCLIFIVATAYSQGGDVRANRVIADSVLIPPLRDTTFSPTRIGQRTTRPQNNRSYIAISLTPGTKRWEREALYSETAGGGGSMVYPDPGIALSDGSGWLTSITDNSSNWNTAFGWGNHAGLYFLLSDTAAKKWDWGDITGVPDFLTSYTETDPLSFKLTDTASKTWDWGDITGHPTFLTSFTETDPIYSASSWFGTTNNSSNWNTAFGWGNHAGLYFLLSDTASKKWDWGDITGVPFFLSDSGALIQNRIGSTQSSSNFDISGLGKMDQLQTRMARIGIADESVIATAGLVIYSSDVESFIKLRDTVANVTRFDYRKDGKEYKGGYLTYDPANTESFAETVNAVTRLRTPEISSTATHLIINNGTSEGVGIGAAPDITAALDINSTTKGFLVPRMTASQRLSISSPEESLIVYDTDSLHHMVFTDGEWKQIKYKGEGLFYFDIMADSSVFHELANVISSDSVRLKNIRVITPNNTDPVTGNARSVTINLSDFALQEHLADSIALIRTLIGSGGGGSTPLAIGDTVTGARNYGIPYFDAGGEIQEDSTNFGYDHATKQVYFPYGTPGEPSITSSFDRDVGLYFIDYNGMGFAIGGSNEFYLKYRAMELNRDYQLRWGDGSITSSDGDVGINSSKSGELQVTNGSAAWGDLKVKFQAYGSGWASDSSVATKKAIYDKIESISGAGETNTASNLGGGLANYDSKSGVDLRFNSFASSDFDLASNVISIDATLKSNWNTAFGWGNHASAGYLLSSTAASTYQPLDADLTAIAALSASNDDFIQKKSGAWTNRTIAQVKSDLGITNALSVIASNAVFGQTTGVDVLTWTVPNDGNVYIVDIASKLLVTSAGGGSVKTIVTFKDENNIDRELTFYPDGGTSYSISAAGLADYNVKGEIDCYPNTNVTITTVVTGTITYNSSSTIVAKRTNGL